MFNATLGFVALLAAAAEAQPSSAPTQTPPAEQPAAPEVVKPEAPKAAIKPPPPPALRGFAWFEDKVKEGPLHYAFYYAPDYVAVATMGLLTVGLLIAPPAPARKAAWGPAFNPDNRDTHDVFLPQYDGVIGRPFKKDTVPSWAPPVVGNGALLATGVLAFATSRSFRKVHHFLLGAAEAQLATQVVGELMKSSVGRLRPDYRDRMARYYCAPGNSPPSGVDCAPVREEARELESQGRSSSEVWISLREFNDGRRSFPSGHAFNSFATATYLALFLGGEFVWGESSTAATRLPAIAAQIAAMTAAGFVAGSRLTDGRHHAEDVVVGAGLGAGMAAAFYFLHFDLQGRPYVRSLSFVPFAAPGALGLGFKGLLP